MPVKPVYVLPGEQEFHGIADTKPAVRKFFDKRLIPEMPDHLVDQPKARFRDRSFHRTKVFGQVALRPPHAGVFGVQQCSDHAACFRGTQVGKRFRSPVYGRYASAVDMEQAGNV